MRVKDSARQCENGWKREPIEGLIEDVPGDTTELIKQTKISADLARKYKTEAAIGDKRIKDLYAVAVEDFLKHRAQLMKSGRRVQYLVSPADEEAREVNVTVPFSLMQKAVNAADEDGVSTRRFLYTALVHYSEKMK